MCKRRSSSKCREVIIRSSPFNSEPNNSFLWVFTSSSLDCAQGKENVNPTGSFLSLIFCFSMKSPRQSATWSKSCRQKENQINQSVFLCVAPVHRAGPDVTPPLYLMDFKRDIMLQSNKQIIHEKLLDKIAKHNSLILLHNLQVFNNKNSKICKRQKNKMFNTYFPSH